MEKEDGTPGGRGEGVERRIPGHLRIQPSGCVIIDSPQIRTSALL